MNDASAALAYLTEHQDRLIERLCELVRVPSISTDPAHEGDCRRAAAWLADYLKGLGLATEIAETGGRPAVLARWLGGGSDARTVLLYGHYDVQPPDPLGPWLCDPFAAHVQPTDAGGQTVPGGVLIGRGVCDNKGQHLAMLAGVEAWLKTAGRLPINLNVLIEGEEEIGSEHLPQLVRRRAKELAADAVVLADAEMIRPGRPTLIYATRGLVYATLTVRGPKHDIHSGGFGGVVANPANGLARLIAGLHDAAGRVTLDGFYDGVAELTEPQREQLRALGVSDEQIASEAGVDRLGGGEAGRMPLERNWFRPTCDANGLSGGYQGPGAKTIIPASATAKVSFRLVAGQDPDRVAAAFENYVRANCPPGLTGEVRLEGGLARPYRTDRNHPVCAAVAAAVRAACGVEPAWAGGGGTLPILAEFKEILGIDSILLGLARPDSNAHGPNEQFNVADFHAAARISACLLAELAE